MPEDTELDLGSSTGRDPSGLPNRFAGLHVYDPSQEFLEAPPVERPAITNVVSM